MSLGKRWFFVAVLVVKTDSIGSPHSSGFALLEVAVALFLFTLAMWGVMSAHIMTARASYDALQRTVALALARDMVARVRANPEALHDYALRTPANVSGDPVDSLPDCHTIACTPRQLAHFDLREWQRGLDGEWEQESGVPVGVLLSPSACVGGHDGVLEVMVSWVTLAAKGSIVSAPCSPAASQDTPPLARRTGREFLRLRIELALLQ